MTTAPMQENKAPAQSHRSLGVILYRGGLAGCYAALLAAVFIKDYRFVIALLGLVFWVVFKIGKTILRKDIPQG